MDFSQKTEVWQAFDKLFDTTKQAQERESQGQRLNNLASAIDKIDSTKLNSERLEDNELTSLLDDTKTFIEMIKSNELSNDEKAQAYDELYNTLEALKEGLLVLGSNDSQVENLLNQLGDEELSSLMANRPTSSLMYRKENSGLVFENKNGIINTGNNKSSEGFDEYAEQRIEYDGESGYETDDNSNRANDNRGLQADSQGQMRVSERHQYAMGLSTAGLQGTARRFEGNELRRGAGNYVGRPLANAKLTNLIKTKFNKKEVSDVAFVQLDKTVANMQYFSDKLEKARTGKFGYFVDGKSVEELMNPKTEVYLSDDGKTGFVIERDYHGHEGVNNIAGVFNYSEDGVKPKNGVVSVLINAIQQGGNALDCFADGLETMYAQIGFVPYAKNPFAVEYAIGDENWERDYLSKNKELPSVMAMYFAYNDINDYARNMKNIDIVSLFENVPIADDYDKMLDSRDEFVQQQKNNQQVAETNADPNIYTKNIDFIRDSETSVLVPYTTEQMVGRIRVGKPVDTSDIQTLLETDKNMTSYQRSVLTKEIEAIRTLTANPILYNTILDKYSQTKDYNLTYDEVMKAMKELDSNFKFESKRAGLELIKRAIAHSSWNTTESLNINFISSIKTNADLDSLALDLKRKGYLDKELVNRPVTSLRRIAESLEKRRTISEATYENARKEIADSLNTTLLRVAFNGGISYEDSNNVYNSDTVSINAKEFANTIYNADLPEEYRKALENGAYNDTLLAEITNYIQGQENKTREQESANASLAKENETLTQTLNDTQEQYLADLQLATSEINDYKAQINSLNQSLETLKTDLENKKIKLEDYKKIEAKLKTDLRTANAKYAMYMGEKKSREINEKIKKTSTLNREIQDHTTGRDLQLLYGDLNIKKDILEKSNGIKMNSDVKTYFPSLYTWLEDKGIIANDKIYGNLGDLTVEERTELLEHLKDYRNLTKSILSQRNSDKANKASSDAIIMKRDMRLGDYKLTQEQEDNIQLQIDKTIAQKRQNNEVIEDEQAYRNTLYLDLASKTLLGQAKAESRPGNREYRKKNTEGLFKSIRLSWDIPRNILKSMGKGIERLVLGGYDESGNEVIGAEQLTSDKLRAVDKRLKGLETAIIETFGDNLKKKGKVSKFDMLNIFALDTSKLEDTQFKMFEFKPKLQDDGSISYEYSPTEKMKEYIKSTDPMIARVSQSLYELAVRQDMAGFDNSEEIFNYTIENKMAIYTLAKQSYALNTLWQSNNLRASQIFRIFSDFVDAEKGTKYNKAKRLADWIQVDAESRFNEINNISIKLDNKDLTDVKVLDYFGLLFDNSPMYEALKITLNPEANTQEQNYMLANGFLQDRTGNRKQLKLDLLSSWEKQIQRQEHYIAFAEYFDNMKRIMVDNGLFEDIKRTQGEKTASWLNSFFRDISNASHKVEDSAEIVTKSFGWMRSNLAKAALAWNISPILTQPATLAYAINEGVPLSYLFSAMRSVASKDTKAMIYELSPQMKKQSKAEINLAKATGKDMAYMSNRGKAQRYIDIVSEVGMKPMELADTYVKNTLWLAKYNQSYDNYIKEGFDSSYSSKRAGYDADVFVMDSQSNTSAKNTPAVYRSKNDLVRLALMFTSQSNKQFWYLANNISNMEVGKRIGIIARNMVGISMAIALTSLAHGKMIPKKDEDIEEWLTRLMKEYAGETLSTIPIAGQLVSQYQYGSSSGISLPVADVFQDAYNFTYTLFDEEKTSDTRTKGEKLVTATKNLMLDIAGSFGMPKQAVKKVYNAIVDENLLKALGYDWGELIE